MKCIGMVTVIALACSGCGDDGGTASADAQTQGSSDADTVPDDAMGTLPSPATAPLMAGGPPGAVHAVLCAEANNGVVTYAFSGGRLCPFIDEYYLHFTVETATPTEGRVIAGVERNTDGTTGNAVQISTTSAGTLVDGTPDQVQAIPSETDATISTQLFSTITFRFYGTTSVQITAFQ